MKGVVNLRGHTITDVLTDLNRRLHGLRDHEFLSVPCGVLKAWRDEIVRLRQYAPRELLPQVRMTVMQEKIWLAVSGRGERGITRYHLVNEVYNGADGGPMNPGNTISAHVWKLNQKIKPHGYKLQARGNDAQRYKLVKL